MDDLRSIVSEIKSRLTIPAMLPALGCPPTPQGGPSTRTRCPVGTHEDKNPSALVEDDWFYCRSCHEGGDLFKLWILKNGGTFTDALRALADRAGVPLKLTEEQQQAYRRARETQDLYGAAHERLVAWLVDANRGLPAREFLDSRGIDPDLYLKDVPSRIRLGYDPTWDSLRDALTRGAGATDDTLRDAGLYVESKSKPGHFYDAVAQCIVFPLYEGGSLLHLRGRGIGDQKRHADLGGEGRAHPPLYYPAGRRPRKGQAVILVEGEMDALTVEQAVRLLGLEKRYVVAATYGAGKSVNVVAVELAHANQVICLSDDDPAGHDLLDKLGRAIPHLVYVARLPYATEKLGDDGQLLRKREKDPNDRLMGLIAEVRDGSRGRELFAGELKGALDDAQPFLDVAIDKVLAEATTSLAKARAIEERVVPLLAALPEVYLDTVQSGVAKRLGLTGRALGAAIVRFRRAGAVDHHDDTSAAEKNVDHLVDALSNVFSPLFYDRDRSTVVTFWSAPRRQTFDVELGQPKKIPALVAPDLGPHDVISWVVRHVPTIEPNKAEDYLARAFQAWATRIPPRVSLEKKSEGIHVLPDHSTLVVDGQQFYRFFPKDRISAEATGRWEELDSPVVDDAYLLEGHPAKPWCTWGLKELRKPLVYRPAQVFEYLEDMLRQFWFFREEVDCTFHALNCFALCLSSLWPRKPLIHVNGGTNSGKSRLIAGFYAGKAFDLPGFLPTCWYGYDASGAGAVSRLQNSTMTVILDEAESDEVERKHLEDFLRLMRASTMGGASTLRGTSEGGYRESTLEVAAMTASIQLFEKIADVNRWFSSVLIRQADREPPEQGVLNYLESLELDAQEMRRTIAFGLLPKVEDLRRWYGELRRYKPLTTLDPRFIENWIPAAVIARAIGKDPEDFLNRMAGRHKGDFEEVQDAAEDRCLMRALLFNPFSTADGRGTRFETTLWEELNRSTRQNPINLPGCGIWTDESPRDPYEQLLVQWETAKASVLKGTVYSTWSGKRLRSVAEQSGSLVVSHRKISPSRTDNGKQARVGRFYVEKLLDLFKSRTDQGKSGHIDPDDNGLVS